MSTDAYAVEGYGERTPSYDGPYLDGHRMDPNVQFAFSGDPEKQAQLQEIIEDTEGAPTLANGVVTIKTGKGEPNVVIHTANTDEVKTIVLEETRVDELSRKNEEALLQGSVPRFNEKGEQVNEEEVDLTATPSTESDNRDGQPYNVTDQGPRADESTIEAGKEQALKRGPQPTESSQSDTTGAFENDPQNSPTNSETEPGRKSDDSNGPSINLS